MALLLPGGPKWKVQEEWEWRSVVVQAWDVILRGIYSSFVVHLGAEVVPPSSYCIV